MLGIDVIKTTEELIIKWQLAKVNIPLMEVINIGIKTLPLTGWKQDLLMQYM